MTQILSKIIIFTIIMFSCSLRSNEVLLTEGQAAPNFTLQDQEGNEHTLSSYRGKKVVIYFYPKDDNVCSLPPWSCRVKLGAACPSVRCTSLLRSEQLNIIIVKMIIFDSICVIPIKITIA